MGQNITVRRPTFDFTDLPRRWVGGSGLGTAYGNAGHVFIPLGEQFFIDTVRGFRDGIDDPELRRDVSAFIGQESVHQRTHEQLWSILVDQGVPVESYAEVISSIRSVERFVPARLRLAVTAALEHYTAAFGLSFLTEDLAAAVPDEMARLLAWHGLEELEHRSVAFDVLQTVDDGYLLRVSGFAVASLLLMVVPAVGVVMLRPDRSEPVAEPSERTSVGDLLGMTRRLSSRMGRHLLDYLRPGFHPAQMEMPPEADAWAESLAS